MIKAALFDFDDTLVDTLHSKIPAIIEYCFSVHNVEVSPNEVATLWGMPFWEKMKLLTKSGTIDTERYLAISEKHPLAPFPESEAVLTALQSRLQIGIVTSLARPVLLHSLNALSWSNIRFSVVVAEGEALANKPDPRVFEPAITSLGGIQRHEILYVGDSLSDARAASDAGLRFIGVGRNPQRRAIFSDAGFQWQPSLSEIVQEVCARELRY